MKTTICQAAVIFVAATLTGCGLVATSTAPDPEGTQEMPKTLVFNFDGTDDQPSDVKEFAEDKNISNIYKLHLLMGGGQPDVRTPGGGEQRAFYYQGIGTHGTWFQRVENETVAPLHRDVRLTLDKAHNNFREYAAGDRVVVFGFSRGAALARKFVSEILDSREHENIEVAFLGVFDTVAEMGGIRNAHLFKGQVIKAEDLDGKGTLTRRGRVQRAVHIVALDEDRITFAPTLINKKKGDPRSDRILEAWFPGIHTDIGGSHLDDGLSDLTLTFMIEQLKRTVRDAIQIADGDWESVNAVLKRLKENDPNEYQGIEADDVVIHPTVTGRLHENRGWRTTVEEELQGPMPRTVCVKVDDKCDENQYPLVHHSVKERIDRISGYRPFARIDVPFKLLLANGEQSRPIHGISGLRETAMTGPVDSGGY